ncbi:MAG: DUF4097 family beta strand repeat-containing protein [Elusimicrobiales bacterium]|nr:DUF4097 family beta strand repeat-containing protein [Elusimicrobiales bacterium]
MLTTALSLCLLAAAAAPAAAAESFPAAGLAGLRLDSEAAFAGVYGSTGPAIVVEQFKDNAEFFSVTLETVKGRLEIKAALKPEKKKEYGERLRRHNSFLLGLFSKDSKAPETGFRIRLPGGLDAEVTLRDGDIDISGLRGKVAAGSGTGRISISKISGAVEAATRTGKLEVSDIEGSVALEGGTASVSAERIAGDARVKTGTGSIDVKAVSGGADLAANTGSIRLAGVAGPLKAVSGTGSIKGETASAKVEARTNTGSIALSGLTGRAAARCGTGSVTLAWDKAPAGGSAEASADTGSLALSFPAGAKLRADLSSGTGSVRNEFENFSGEGAFMVTAKAGTGSVKLVKNGK